MSFCLIHGVISALRYVGACHPFFDIVGKHQFSEFDVGSYSKPVKGA